MSLCKLSYDDFLLTMKQELQLYLGEDYVIEHKEILKNNGVILDAFLIHEFDQRVVPTIYINSYYQRFLSGSNLYELVEDIIGVYESSHEESSQMETDFSFDFLSIQHKIVFRLVNLKKNESMLRDIAHIKFLNLAIIFHCIVKNDEDGIGTVRISKKHLGEWNLTIKELFEIAKDNTVRLFPPVLRPMEDIINDLMEQTSESNNLLVCPCEKDSERQMYVLTNTRGMNGAATILYPNVVNACMNQLGGEFYLLPSSIHEVILIPKIKKAAEETAAFEEHLRSMVIEINETQVAAEEVLSNHVYDSHTLLETLSGL